MLATARGLVSIVPMSIRKLGKFLPYCTKKYFCTRVVVANGPWAAIGFWNVEQRDDIPDNGQLLFASHKVKESQEAPLKKRETKRTRLGTETCANPNESIRNV